MIDQRTLVLASLACAVAGEMRAQKLPPIRALGPITRVSTEPLASIVAALPLSDGRVFVNDIVARRVVVFDSTLTTAHVVTDSASVTATAYGFGAGALIPYRADSALFLDPQSGAMPVLSPSGRIARVMATPRPTGRPLSVGSLYFTPAFDTKGRLVHYLPLGFAAPRDRLRPDTTLVSILDSAIIVRYDFGTQAFDTIASIKMPRSRQTVTVSETGGITSIRNVTADPVPMVDDWVVRSDGALVIVRGRDFHVDWMSADGKWSSAPKLGFEWQHLDDALKQVLIDSAAKADKARRDSIVASIGRGGDGGAITRSGRGGGVGDPTRPPLALPTFTDPPLQPNDVSDYRPAFLHGSTKVDTDENLWIRTTTMVNGQPVYDVVDPKGVLVDRVQLPPFRTIAGFGPGVMYLAVKDAAGRVFLEKARVSR